MTPPAIGGADLWSALDARASATPDAVVLIDRKGAGSGSPNCATTPRASLPDWPG
jgi:hypothetical protein